MAVAALLTFSCMETFKEMVKKLYFKRGSKEGEGEEEEKLEQEKKEKEEKESLNK